MMRWMVCAWLCACVDAGDGGDAPGDGGDAPGDADGDGFASEDDCDDTDADIFPGAPERCNDLDDDCDGDVDEDAGVPHYADADGDGYGGGEPDTSCDPPEGWLEVGGDCDDTDAAVNPDAVESCDNQDNDCSGVVDDGDLVSVPGNHATLSAAIEAAPDGTEICVGPGVYPESLALGGRQLTLVSAAGASATTLSMASLTEPLVDMPGPQAGGPSGDVTLRGFTVTGKVDGALQSQDGAFVRIRRERLTLQDILVTDNSLVAAPGVLFQGGGLVYSDGGDLVFDNVQFLDNTITLQGDGGAGNHEAKGLALWLIGGSLSSRGLVLRGNRLLTDERARQIDLDGGIVLIGITTLDMADTILEDNHVDLDVSFSSDIDGALATFEGVAGVVEDLHVYDNTVRMHAGEGGNGADLHGTLRFDGAYADVRNVHVDRNLADLAGAASSVRGTMYVRAHVGALHDLYLAGNEARGSYGVRGGALLVRESETAARRVDVRDTLSVAPAVDGGGAWIQSGRDPFVLSNAVFAGNVSESRATRGGGAYLYAGGDYTASHITAYRNATTSSYEASGAGLYLRTSSLSGEDAGTLAVSHVTCTGNEVLGVEAEGTDVGVELHFSGFDWTYGNVGDAFGAELSSLDVPPGFVDTSGDDPLAWDLHLRADSPLVDQGSSSVSDADGSAADIGAYGGPEGDW